MLPYSEQQVSELTGTWGQQRAFREGIRKAGRSHVTCSSTTAPELGSLPTPGLVFFPAPQYVKTPFQNAASHKKASITY